MSTRNDHVALVMRGGRGIGRAMALPRAGGRIAVPARTRVELEEVVSAITAEKGQAVALTADLADQQCISTTCTPSCWLRLSLCAVPVTCRA
jgi:NAD(P)-dependent dehydrogenase (short-subunit alcohol dehydrogenase family)